MIKNAAHLSNIIARKAQKIVEPWAMHYWHDAPFANAPLAAKETYMKLWEEEKQSPYPEIDTYEQETEQAIDPDWFHELALHTQITIKSSPLCYQHGRVLYVALRTYLASQNDLKNLNILETGTARGFSSTIMAKALDDANMKGKILTLDLLPHHKPIYWNCIDDHDGPKTRAELLAPWKDLTENIIYVESDSQIALQKLALGRVHFAFLDGGHGYKDVIAEFSMIAPKQHAGDVIIFDDYNTALFPGVVQAVDEGCEKFGYTKHVIPGRDNRAYVVATKT